MSQEQKNRIKLIQQILKAEGEYSGKVDGIYGPLTLKAINKRFGTLNQDWSTDRLITGLIQMLATEKNIDAGKIDGLWGPQTEYAFSALSYLIKNGSQQPGWRPDTESSSLNPNNWPSQNPESDIIKFFGEPGTNQALFDSPYPMKLAWDTDQVVNRFTCHKLVHESLSRILKEVLSAYGIEQIQKLGLDLFGGCFNVRKMRGGNRYSMHSWGIALDFDPARNRLNWGRDKAEFAKPEYEQWWSIWENEGWVSLGRERNFDWMHVQAAII